MPQMKPLMWMFIALMNYIYFFFILMILNSYPKTIKLNFMYNNNINKWKWHW
uniref:ATP synthase F0 subunit 8 n=1 Tax=Tetrapedia diversipes TaxID=889126 RepID=UPI001EF9FC60|nr:ATP synthase F0 subunit 8 [Tetrapedia diversipes]UKG21056.1 ATP synthase F0 subunit 8 [Tetrapedia diversipes]